MNETLTYLKSFFKDKDVCITACQFRNEGCASRWGSRGLIVLLGGFYYYHFYCAKVFIIRPVHICVRAERYKYWLPR